MGVTSGTMKWVKFWNERGHEGWIKILFDWKSYHVSAFRVVWIFGVFYTRKAPSIQGFWNLTRLYYGWLEINSYHHYKYLALNKNVGVARLWNINNQAAISLFSTWTLYSYVYHNGSLRPHMTSQFMVSYVNKFMMSR